MAARIMIVDDNVSDGQTLAFILSHAGHEIQTFENPVEALKKVYEYDPDLIICDFHMPEMDGGEFISHIRKNGRSYPILFITADDSREVVLKVFRLGAADLILKGAKPKEFEDTVNRALEMESLRAQMYGAPDEETRKKIGRLLGLHQSLKAKKPA